jgi:lipopolysaccharide transport system ATP-binding protein
MADSVSIRVERLWKHYGLSARPGIGQLARAVVGKASPQVGDEASGLWALRNLSFEVKRGETVGIIGRNGAGKSTLLKVLAGVSPPSRGRVEVHGRVFPMIELNAGVHPELTGRENTYLLGAIMGMPRRRMASLLPAIEEFVELGEWFDRPVRTYSSGMVARLGFGVATRIESDILLIDETFAVGDLKFQNKSLARIKELRESGATVILVTHSLDMLQFVAQRGIVLDRGMIVSEGTATEGLNAYEHLIFNGERQTLAPGTRRITSTETVSIEAAHVIGCDGTPVQVIQEMKGFGLEVVLRLDRSIERPVFAVGIVNSAGVLCVWNVSQEEGLTCGSIEGTCRLSLWYQENRLGKGTYEVHLSIRDGNSFETLERVAGLVRFTVVGSGRARGIVVMPPRWELTRQSTDHDAISFCRSENNASL